MKKFALAAVAAAAMTVGVAHAYTAGTFSNGVVVPNVIHNGAGDTTAVGLINQGGTTRSVYWTFFDKDSEHVTDGCFTMTNKDYHPFVWANESGLGMEGKGGYLVFALGDNGACGTGTPATSLATGGTDAADQLAAHAFQVKVAAKDVEYTPVIDGPLTITGNLTTLGPNSLSRVAGAADVGDQLSMRYYLDGGSKTTIVVWSTGDQSGSHTVNMFDDKQNRKSVNFTLVNEELDWFDPSKIAGRPADFTDGFIEWTASGATLTTGSVFSYSVIDAPAFGAAQTVLGFHK